MSLDPDIRRRLTLPAICAPMTAVTNPELVIEACKAGVVGALPSHNAGSFEAFEAWMSRIDSELKQYADQHPGGRVAPIALNLRIGSPDEVLSAQLKVAARCGVKIIITAKGDPTEMARRVHDFGGLLFHDVTNLKHAEKAIAAGVDGLNCIGYGGGGSSGPVSHLVLIPKIRSMFSGTIVLAGSVSTGAMIRAGEVLGADLAYLGTRFIATQESMAHPEYKKMITTERSTGLVFSAKPSGVPAWWMTASLARKGLHHETMPASSGPRNYDHLPDDCRPWRDLWSAGQGIDLIDDVPTVAELVARLRQEYVAACQTPSMLDAASERLVDQALSAAV